ncbi:MAG: nuclear transport factor 2 family protein [Bacteroidales bacterium]|jgi:predicted SnoaL-like aldol condensation-catalyzing enzyme
MSATKNKQAILLCIELYNNCTLKWLDTCYSDKLEWIELSNPGAPQGRRGNFEFYRKFAEQVLNLFPDRKLTVLRSLAEKDCVVLEQEWQGTFAFTAGNHIAGEITKLRIASFFTLDNGLIIKQIDYCAQAT